MNRIDYSSTGEWLRDTGPERDVVVSSRVRLARNITGFKFANSADAGEQKQIVELTKSHVEKIGDDGTFFWLNLRELEKDERELLLERHLISKNLVKATHSAAVVIRPDESMSIMVNEEDHLRMQVMRSGLQLREAYQEVNAIDDQLEPHLQFAFHKRFGYLTACPTNVGTGIRISVMLHLPGLMLTNEIERVRRAARDMQLAIRGFYGEGSEALGDLYQISNQTTFGKTEEELLDEFDRRVIPEVITYEREARKLLLRKRCELLDDRVFRALGILQNARLLKAGEAMRLLSHLRLGIEMGRIPNVSCATVHQLILLCQPAHLQRAVGRSLNQAERSLERANVIRAQLGSP